MALVYIDYYMVCIYIIRKKATATNKCTSVAGHFNGHADVL